jgi:SAM-dependent methyltransferase
MSRHVRLLWIVNALRRTKAYLKLRGGEFSARERWETRWSDQNYSPPWLNQGISADLTEAVWTGWLAPEESVIDLGCGEGDVTAWLAGLGYAALGVDIAPAAIRRARDKYPELDPDTFRVLDLANESLDQRFSSMLDRGCFHTVRPIFRDSYVANVASMARPGTRLLLFMKAFLNEGADSEARYAAILQQVEDSFGSRFDIERHRRATFGADDLPGSSASPIGIVLWMRHR